VLQVRGSRPLLRFRVDGDQTIKLSEHLNDEDWIDRKPTDSMQHEGKVRSIKVIHR